jgi:nitronate monooxygenase
MMLRTRFTDLVGCSIPLQLAPMPGVCSPDLVVAVADAGGLAMIGLPMVPPPLIGATLDGLARRTQGAFGLNFLMPFFEPAALEVAASRARVIIVAELMDGAEALLRGVASTIAAP